MGEKLGPATFLSAHLLEPSALLRSPDLALEGQVSFGGRESPEAGEDKPGTMIGSALAFSLLRRPHLDRARLAQCF